MSWQDGVREAYEHAREAGVAVMIVDTGFGLTLVVETDDQSKMDDALREAEAFLVRQEEMARSDRCMVEKGGCFARRYEDLMIFGRLYTDEEIEASEKPPVDEVDDDEEWVSQAHWDSVQMWLARSEEAGMAFGMCYSEACERGEPGMTPRQLMIEISLEQFEQAKLYGWGPLRIAEAPGGDWIVDVAQRLP